MMMMMMIGPTVSIATVGLDYERIQSDTLQPTDSLVKVVGHYIRLKYSSWFALNLDIQSLPNSYTDAR